MTKFLLYDRILIMNTLRRKLSLFLLFICFVVCTFIGGIFTVRVNAQQGDVSLYLPQSDIDVLDLNTSAPAHATVYDGGSAIITENKKLYIYDTDGYVEYTLLPFNNPGQIRYLGDDKLLVNDDLRLYTIDLTDLSLAPQPFTCGSDQITSSYFYINQNYLTTISNNQIFLYQLNDNQVEQVNISNVDSPKLNSPVCVNQNGEIFFIRSSDTKLCIYDGTNGSGTPMFNLSIDGISNMVSKDGTLYFTKENSVWCIDENTKNSDTITLKELSCNDEFDAYDLGTIENPTDMHFYGDNLVITDSQKNAVQQFNIVDNQLVFTGKAIAKDKTAYNRISVNATKIQASNNYVAVLDNFKLTVLPNQSNYDRYDKDNYKNYLVSNIGMPLTFALGNNTILLGFENGVKKIDIDSALNNDLELTSIPNLKSIIFFNNKYYVLTNDGTYSKIFVTDENLSNITEIYSAQIPANVFTVDVYENVYLFNQTDVYKNGEHLNTEIGITSLFTDLNGNLFSIKENKIRYLDDTDLTWKDFLTSNQNIKSLANNVYTDDLYFLLENSEFIYKTNPDEYASIIDITIPDDFKLTDKSVTNQLKVYTVNQNRYAYGINVLYGVTYLSHVIPESEYAFVSKTQLTGVNGQTEYFLLAGENGVTLTHVSSATEKSVSYDTDVTENVYVTTDVNAYYFPIITKTNQYTLNNIDGTFRLSKGDVIKPLNKFTFDGIEFYKAELLEDGAPVYGYVPVSFTVKVLSVDVSYDTYTIEKVTKTTLYSDQALTCAILEINEGSSVRVCETLDGVLKVWYQTEDGFIEGYISSDDLIDNPNIQVRNILIVLAVSACLCGSITYFVIRSKRD